MTTPVVGLCTIEFHLPGMRSLKEKRGILKSMLARLRNTFNVSAAEVDHQDVWQSATIAIAVVSNSNVHVTQTINKVQQWIENHFPDAIVVNQDVELL
jgi:hypothetical protein